MIFVVVPTKLLLFSQNSDRLSDCDGTLTHNRLACKGTLNHLVKLAK